MFPGNRTVGISAFAPFVPALRLDLRTWCQWRGHDWQKIAAVTGSGFRLPGPREDAYTMAAAAVMRLVRSGCVDPARVGFLALATESSRDGAVGAVIVKGMVDQALCAEGRALLARDCEVPEIKQACLAGIYALKAAVRWLAWDGRGRQAIIVASDVAQYRRDSTGEHTQGAGAVAVLLEEDPRLLLIDLDASAGTSVFRGNDFRKPVLRHFIGSEPGRSNMPDECPVFNGPYSAACYLDETLRAVESLAVRLGTDVGGILATSSKAFFHRPFRKMPRDALALLRLRAMADSEKFAPGLTAICAMAGVEPDKVRSELEHGSNPGKNDTYAWPAVASACRVLKDHESFRNEAERLMGLGESRMAECGNLYAASILAWMASGLEDAAAGGMQLAGASILAVGYGSGNAAEASLLQVAEGWREAALGTCFDNVMAGAVNLDHPSYEALHDGRPVAHLLDRTSDGFAVDRVGWGQGPGSDAGVEHYRYDPTGVQ